MKLAEANLEEEYLTPKGLRIKILRKNTNGSTDIELLDVLENGKHRELTITKIDAANTELKSLKKEKKEDKKMGKKENEAKQECCDGKKEGCCEEKGVHVTAEVTPKEKKVKKEKAAKEPKAATKNSVINEFLLKGGLTADEIAAEVVKVFPSEDVKRVKNQISVRVSFFAKNGYKVEKSAEKKITMTKE